jgi:polyribonucleotide nucleotidyltransferase
MATVCGGILCLMDGGVPVRDIVAGIAMGLLKEGDDVVILSDIWAMKTMPAIWFQGLRTEKGVNRHADGHQDRRPD